MISSLPVPKASSKNSKWVWSGNTTITNCRQPRGTARKSRSTITRHLDDITHVAKSVRSVRRGLCGVKWGSMNLTVKHLNYFYKRIILVLLYQNDVKVNSDLVYLYMYMHSDIHMCGTSLSTLRSQTWQIVGIPMGTNCAPLVADLFLFCYERDFMLSLSDNNQANIIEAFNSTSRYLDDLLNIDNPYFEQMVGQIYPTELQLNKANSSDTEAPFLDLNLSITNGIVSSKIYDKRMILILK